MDLTFTWHMVDLTFTPKVREAALEVLDEWQAHELEAWCAVFSRAEVSN
jgi:hypothetical protein